MGFSGHRCANRCILREESRITMLVIMLGGLTLCLIYGIKETLDKHREDTDNESD